LAVSEYTKLNAKLMEQLTGTRPGWLLKSFINKRALIWGRISALLSNQQQSD